MSFESWLRYGSDDTKISAASASTKPSSTIRLSTGDPLLDRLAELDDDNFQAEKEAKLAVQVNFAEESDQRVLRNAILAAMENPYYMEGRGAAGGGRFLLNAPSILSGQFPVPITFGRRETVRQLLKAAASNDRIAQKFKEAVLGQIPKAKKERLLRRLLKFEKNELPDLEEKVREYRKNSKRLLKFEGWDSHLKLRRGEDVQCFRPPGTTLLHPDWYVGMVEDTFLEIEGRSNYTDPTGRVIFGGGSERREMPIRLPDTPTTSMYPLWFATQLMDYRGNVHLGLQDIIGDLEQYGIDPFFLYLFFWSQTNRTTGLDEPEGESYVIIWHYPFWKCCFESLGRYGLESNSYGYCTNIFDSMTLIADQHVEFEALGQPIHIDAIRVVLNNVEICRIDAPQQLVPSGEYLSPLFLSTAIRDTRLAAIQPIDPPSTAAPLPGPSPAQLVGMAVTHPIVTELREDLGQAWSPKYGAEWESIGGSWSSGPLNWCTESSVFFMLQAASTMPLYWPVQELRLLFNYGRFLDGNNVLRWFKCRGRYIDGASSTWDSVGRLAMSGSWTSVENHHHFGFLLYWSLPPYVPFPDNPGHPDNDPLNTLNSRWDGVASQFNPLEKVNRFRMISGNWADRVRVFSWSIVRVASQMELDAWQSAFPIGLSYWRDRPFADEEVLQDGFGQVVGPSLFPSNQMSCESIRWSR